MVEIPSEFKDLLEDPVVVSFVTILPDGGPQATAVWASWDGQHILVNTAKGRQKDQNVRANPNVAVLAIDPKDPYRYLEVRGKVTEITEEGAIEHIDALTKMYTGKEKYFGDMAPADAANKMTRVILKITPEHVTTH